MGVTFAFIGPCCRLGVGRRPSGWRDRRECCEGEMQKDGEVGGASRAPTAAVGGQPLLRGPDGRNRQRSRGRREVRPVNDLTVLTPPLLMCAAFLIAVGAFLRHEMVASRRRRDRDQSADISGESTIPDSTSSQATARPDDAGASRAD